MFVSLGQKKPLGTAVFLVPLLVLLIPVTGSADVEGEGAYGLPTEATTGDPLDSNDYDDDGVIDDLDLGGNIAVPSNGIVWRGGFGRSLVGDIHFGVAVFVDFQFGLPMVRVLAVPVQAKPLEARHGR